ncbi:MAG: hypothetical protein DYG89_24575 [Caldilinea sp. CFX5]|nr:hypothetical protein [Caldilinea sp. CFX5]
MSQQPQVMHLLRPLVTTKLYIPQRKHRLVLRAHLLTRLQQSLHCKLTLVCAPPGFGKTTLLGQWLASDHTQTADTLRQRTAWVTLDAEDNDVTQFWRYVLTALARVQPDLGAHLLAAWQAAALPLHTLVKGLINELATLPDDVLLVLDDYHVIEQQTIHDSLLFLLDYLPPNLHLIVASRADPPWPLARFRLNGELIELRVADLCFTTEEITTFFHQVTPVNLSPSEVAILAARTEGWIAGLQAVALSLQDRSDSQEFIQALTGSHRYILDYLVEQVLQRQPEILQTFLLRTALLDRLCGSLCDALMGWDIGEPPFANTAALLPTPYPNSQAILEHLEAANLFTLPLDDERCWYRYHHLFGDLLRKRLETTTPAACVAELHGRAARWYEQHGSAREAVTHALAAQDFPLAAGLIAAEAQTLIQRGEVRRLAGWLAALPTECVRTHAGLSLATAWVRLFLSEFALVEPALQETELALTQMAPSPPPARQVRAEVAAIRAVLTTLRGQLTTAGELAAQAHAELTGRLPVARSMLAFVHGVMARTQGDLPAAHQAFAEAQALSEAGNSLLTALLAGYHLGALQMEQGQLQQAAARYQQALHLVERLGHPGDQALPAVGAPHVGLGRLLLEWHDLAAAHEHLMQGVQLTGQKGGMGLALDGYMALAQLYHLQGDHSALLQAMQEVESRMHRSPYADARDRLADFQAQMALRQGQQPAVAQWVRTCGLTVEDELTYANRGRYLLFARWLIDEQRYPEAQQLLTRLQHFTTQVGLLGQRIEVLTLQAQLAQAQGQEDEAITRLQAALTLAEPEGYIQLFVIQGEALHWLLVKTRATLHEPRLCAYLDRLLIASGAVHLADSDASTTVLPPPATCGERGSLWDGPPLATLIEPLSARELHVLRLLAAGASNQAIAEELVIALTTAKKHVSNIIGKLGVENRTQAVARARALGLLP